MVILIRYEGDVCHNMCQCYTFPHSRADRNKCFIWAFNTEFDFQLLCLHLGSNKVGGGRSCYLTWWKLMQIGVEINQLSNQWRWRWMQRCKFKMRLQSAASRNMFQISPSKSNILNSEAEKCRWQYLRNTTCKIWKNTQLAISTGRNTCLTERVSNFTFSQTFWILSWSCVLELKLTFFILTCSPQFVSDCPALTLLRIL